MNNIQPPNNLQNPSPFPVSLFQYSRQIISKIASTAFSLYTSFFAWYCLTERKIAPLSPSDSKQLLQSPAPFSPYQRFEKFYQNNGVDSAGRTLLHLQEMSLDKKEDIHNYIQWMFPNDKASKFSKDAPVFTVDECEALSRNRTIRTNLKRSFDKMLEFYGLKYHAPQSIVQKRSDFDDRAKVWLRRGNHNFLRMTRILRCLALFGLDREAAAFLGFLETLQDHRAISEKTMKLWKEAAEPIPRPKSKLSGFFSNLVAH